jgi:hypothetical protein
VLIVATIVVVVRLQLKKNRAVKTVYQKPAGRIVVAPKDAPPSQDEVAGTGGPMFQAPRPAPQSKSNKVKPEEVDHDSEASADLQ